MESLFTTEQVAEVIAQLRSENPDVRFTTCCMPTTTMQAINSKGQVTSPVVATGMGVVVFIHLLRGIAGCADTMSNCIVHTHESPDKMKDDLFNYIKQDIIGLRRAVANQGR